MANTPEMGLGQRTMEGQKFDMDKWYKNAQLAASRNSGNGGTTKYMTDRNKLDDKGNVMLDIYQQPIKEKVLITANADGDIINREPVTEDGVPMSGNEPVSDFPQASAYSELDSEERLELADAINSAKGGNKASADDISYLKQKGLYGLFTKSTGQ